MWREIFLGHIRLGRLPKSKKWRDVVNLLHSDATVEQVAAAASTAAKDALLSSTNDPLFLAVVDLLSRLPLEARGPGYRDALEARGIDEPDSIPGFLAGVAKAIDAEGERLKFRSDLGKIDVQGPDAAEFLNRVYVNGWKTLPIGKARYGLMLREDGMVFDDGTTTRLSKHHYFMTVTTAGAGAVMSHLEFLLQSCWTDLRVEVTSATDQWAAIAVSGPKARDLLSSIDSDIDFSKEALPFMSAVEGTMAGLPVRVIRITFTGELGYEVYTPAGYGEAMQEAIIAAGSAYDLSLCGIEAFGALRVEKGHFAGSEITGRTTLDDLGLARMGSTKKPYIGQVLAQREALAAPERQQFVGLRPVDPNAVIKGGSILSEPNCKPQGHGLGYVTAMAFSPVVGSTIGLGLLSGGRARIGTTVNVVDTVDDTIIPAHVTTPHFYDPEGEKARA